MNIKEFLTTKELAELINVTPECVRQWVHRGLIPVRRFGKAVRIPREIAEKIVREGLNSKLDVEVREDGVAELSEDL